MLCNPLFVFFIYIHIPADTRIAITINANTIPIMTPVDNGSLTTTSLRPLPPSPPGPIVHTLVLGASVDRVDKVGRRVVIGATPAVNRKKKNI